MGRFLCIALFALTFYSAYLAEAKPLDLTRRYLDALGGGQRLTDPRLPPQWRRLPAGLRRLGTRFLDPVGTSVFGYSTSPGAAVGGQSLESTEAIEKALESYLSKYNNRGSSAAKKSSESADEPVFPARAVGTGGMGGYHGDIGERTVSDSDRLGYDSMWQKPWWWDGNRLSLDDTKRDQLGNDDFGSLRDTLNALVESQTRTASRSSFDPIDVLGKRPGFDAISMRKRPSFDAIDMRKRPSFDAIDMRKRPSFDAIDMRKRPSFDAIDMRKRPSFDAIDMRKRPSFDAIDMRKRPSFDAIDMRKRPSFDAIDMRKRPSFDAIDMKKRPSFDAISMGTRPDRNSYDTTLFNLIRLWGIGDPELRQRILEALTSMKMEAFQQSAGFVQPVSNDPQQKVTGMTGNQVTSEPRMAVDGSSEGHLSNENLQLLLDQLTKSIEKGRASGGK